jgi:hypothetical protein
MKRSETPGSPVLFRGVSLGQVVEIGIPGQECGCPRRGERRQVGPRRAGEAVHLTDPPSGWGPSARDTRSLRAASTNLLVVSRRGLSRLALIGGKHTDNEPAPLAHFDDGNHGAISIQGDKGPAQVVRLGHRGTPSVSCSDDGAISSPLAPYHLTGRAVRMQAERPPRLIEETSRRQGDAAKSR